MRVSIPRLSAHKTDTLPTELKEHLKTPMAGLEPATLGLEVPRAIHCAT